MKYLIFSDLHGSLYYFEKIIECFEKGEFDKMIFLGDLLYHGPRNDIPFGYNPKELANRVNMYLDKMIFVKGNCDAEVDETVIGAKEPFEKEIETNLNGQKVHLTHGHNISRFNPSLNYDKGDIVLYGHYHTFDYRDIDGVKYVNIGSVTIPKDERRGFATIDGNTLSFVDLDMNVFEEHKF